MEAGPPGAFRVWSPNSDFMLRELTKALGWNIRETAGVAVVLGATGGLCWRTKQGMMEVVGIPVGDDGQDGGGVLAGLAYSWIRACGGRTSTIRAASWLVSGLASRELVDALQSVLAERGTPVHEVPLLQGTTTLFEERPASGNARGWAIWVGLYYGKETVRVVLCNRDQPFDNDEEQVLREALTRCVRTCGRELGIRIAFPD